MTNAEARFNKSLRPRKPEGSLGRTAQDVHLDSHTAPELCPRKMDVGRIYSRRDSYKQGPYLPPPPTPHLDTIRRSKITRRPSPAVILTTKPRFPAPFLQTLPSLVTSPWISERLVLFSAQTPSTGLRYPSFNHCRV